MPRYVMAGLLIRMSINLSERTGEGSGGGGLDGRLFSLDAAFKALRGTQSIQVSPRGAPLELVSSALALNASAEKTDRPALRPPSR